MPFEFGDRASGAARSGGSREIRRSARVVGDPVTPAVLFPLAWRERVTFESWCDRRAI
jgi:hypothetical protein